VDDLDLDDFESTNAYFECPLLPSTRGGSRQGREVVDALVFNAPGVNFLRGDANADCAVDLSDGVSALGWLFSGDAEPGCVDANDSGDVDLSDAVYIFGFLFLADPAPSAPGPHACGPDPSVDEISCQASPCSI